MTTPRPTQTSHDAPLRQAYALMRSRHGHLRWWPGESPLEVCLGAILTQHTSWTNVERAMAGLKRTTELNPHRVLALPEAELAAILKPAGYFNLKAKRLRKFLECLVHEFDGKLDLLLAGRTDDVRKRLLAISGIGPETADCILLYAGGHLSFVVDAYTRRIFQRHGWCDAQATYESVQTQCVAGMGGGSRSSRLDQWQDCHAQLVTVGKNYCRKRQPRCGDCPLRPLLPPALA